MTGKARVDPTSWNSITPPPHPASVMTTLCLFCLWFFPHRKLQECLPRLLSSHFSSFCTFCLFNIPKVHLSLHHCSLKWCLIAHHQTYKVRPSNWNPSFLSMQSPYYAQTPYYTPERREAGDIGLCCCKFEHIEKALNPSNADIFVNNKKRDTELRNHPTVI